MTRKEAIAYFKDMNECTYGDVEPIQMAIQALEKEPCEDAISRQTLIERINNAEENFKADNMESIASDDGDPFVDGVLSGVFNIRQMVIQAPSVMPKQEPKTGWIPVSERLPEENGEYMITWKTSASKRYFIGVCEYEMTNEFDHERNRFNVEWLLEDYIKSYPDVEVIAWMPLPEPYKEG